MSQIARIAISRSCLSGWQRPAVVLSQQVNYKLFSKFHRTFRHFDFGFISYLQTSRALTTTTANKDIDSAAKFIGAGKYYQDKCKSSVIAKAKACREQTAVMQRFIPCKSPSQLKFRILGDHNEPLFKSLLIGRAFRMKFPRTDFNFANLSLK